MEISLSNLANVAERIYKLNVNLTMIIKKWEKFQIKYKDCECCLKYINVKDDFTEYECLCCNKN